MAHEIADNNHGLMIKKGKIVTKISYQNILNVDYRYSYFVLAENFIILKIKPHSQLGDTIRFISWADNSNYNKEFTLNPPCQNPRNPSLGKCLTEKNRTQH